MCHPTHDYAHLLTPEDPAMTTTPATCQLATPARHGRDGRPYTTCGTLVNPAGYCCECGTRCARRMPDDTYQAACGAELREQWDGDPIGHSHHVTTCDLAPGHGDDHLGAILDPDTSQLTGEVVSWPQGGPSPDDGLAQHIDLHPQPVDGCKVCGSLVDAQLAALGRQPAPAGHDYWACQDVACATCHGLDDPQAHQAMAPHTYAEPAWGYMVNDANPSGRMIPDPRARCATCGIERWDHADAMADMADDPRPRDTNGHPSDSPGGIVGTRSLASAMAAYPPVDSHLAAYVRSLPLRAR